MSVESTVATVAPVTPVVKARKPSVSAAAFMAALVIGERENKTAGEVAAALGMNGNSFATRLATERAAFRAEVEAAVKAGADEKSLPTFPKLKDGRTERAGTPHRPSMLELLRKSAEPTEPTEPVAAE